MLFAVFLEDVGQGCFLRFNSVRLSSGGGKTFIPRLLNELFVKFPRFDGDASGGVSNGI